MSNLCINDNVIFFLKVSDVSHSKFFIFSIIIFMIEKSYKIQFSKNSIMLINHMRKPIVWLALKKINVKEKGMRLTFLTRMEQT